MGGGQDHCHFQGTGQSVQAVCSRWLSPGAAETALVFWTRRVCSEVCWVTSYHTRAHFLPLSVFAHMLKMFSNWATSVKLWKVLETGSKAALIEWGERKCWQRMPRSVVELQGFGTGSGPLSWASLCSWFFLRCWQHKDSFLRKPTPHCPGEQGKNSLSAWQRYGLLFLSAADLDM